MFVLDFISSPGPLSQKCSIQFKVNAFEKHEYTHTHAQHFACRFGVMCDSLSDFSVHFCLQWFGWAVKRKAEIARS